MMTVKQVADRLSCSTSLIYDHIASGRLKAYRIGKGRGGLRVSDEQLKFFLQDSEAEVVAPAPVPLRQIAHRSESF
jgi:excisionase family DNA binding protein